MKERPHIVLVERLPGEDTGLDACVDRVTGGRVQVVRFSSVWQALTELRYRQREQGFSALGGLDFVGHGEPGALSVGDAVLDSGPQVQRVLAQLLNPPALVDGGTVLRLLGCHVGLGGGVQELPLGAAGDGAALALTLKRRLGCRVQVSLRGVNPSDFTAHGFAALDALQELRDDQTCTWQAVTAGPVQPGAGD